MTTTWSDDKSWRFMPEGHLVAIRGAMRLERFLREAKTRTPRYFGLVDDLNDAFGHFHGGGAVPSEVRQALAEALALDGTFRAFAQDAAPEDCTSETKWKDIALAGAGTIMIQYDQACGRGDWP